MIHLGQQKSNLSLQFIPWPKTLEKYLRINKILMQLLQICLVRGITSPGF